MKNATYFLLLLLVFACTQPNNKQLSTNNEQNNIQFNAFKERFMEAFWKQHPTYATWSGYHKYDNVLVIPNEESRLNNELFCQQYLDSLKTFEIQKLNSANSTDLMLIKNQLLSSLFGISQMKSYEWNPASYNLGGSFFEVIKYKGHDLETRLHNIHKKLEKVPEYFNAAKANIKNPTIEHSNLAIQQNKGSVSVFEKTLRDSVNASSLSDETKQHILEDIDEAVKAINNYVKWIEEELKPSLSEENGRSFRLGKELYERKFDYNIQSGFSAEEIYRKAIEYRANIHSEMLSITKELWPKYLEGTEIPSDSLQAIRQMIDILSLNHAHRDSFITEIRQQIPELEQFINDKQLLFLDPKKPLVVRETPEYMRGVAGASISAPGPYDADAETYYNVTPLDHYTEDEAESYLREYNDYVLQVLNIHEAIPGHYTQLVYSNNSPSIIKSIFGNGTMIEGWAVYGERMVLEEGYKNSPEMWLNYYKWNLRTVCNTILDYSVHVLGMTEEKALDLLINQAFQQESEAKGKWKRVTLTSVQLCSYFTGYYEIYNFREELKKQAGEKFNLKNFHEKFLSYGSAPVKYIKELMLEDLKEKNLQ
ncbi:DUF885 domain-containing protein [Bacteroidales bacterium AH-315-I05]|nr:DUF885 domain-containing protein [Bacteroidales bacterium AH-315-I05]